jgi:CspA family cold shock protein
MTIGTVKFFNENKGYGFIQPDGGGQDAFVHITAVENSGMRSLRENQRVSYDLQQDRRGKMAAVNLKDATEAAAPAAEAANEPEAAIEPEAANDAQSE